MNSAGRCVERLVLKNQGGEEPAYRQAEEDTAEHEDSLAPGEGRRRLVAEWVGFLRGHLLAHERVVGAKRRDVSGGEPSRGRLAVIGTHLAELRVGGRSVFSFRGRNHRHAAHGRTDLDPTASAMDRELDPRLSADLVEVQVVGCVVRGSVFHTHARLADHHGVQRAVLVAQPEAERPDVRIPNDEEAASSVAILVVSFAADALLDLLEASEALREAGGRDRPHVRLGPLVLEGQ